MPQPALAGGASRPFRLGLFLAFVIGLVICGIAYQLHSGASPSSESAPLEFFTRSMLWMTSLVCLLQAGRQPGGAGRSWMRTVFWLLGCLALAYLALDERFEYHERPERAGWFDDDWFKLASWLGAGVVLLIIARIERASWWARGAMILGFVFHATYVLVEFGDGEFFRLPGFERKTLRWIEEICELLFLASYLFSFLVVLTDPLRPPRAPSTDARPPDA